MSTHRRFFQFVSIFVITNLLFSGIRLPSVSAQVGDGLERQINAQTGKVSFLGPESGEVLPALDALGGSVRPQDPAMALAKRFGLEFGLRDPERDLLQLKSSRAENGRITARYQQTYQGIPVLGGELIVNTNENGDLYSMNGEISPALSLSTQPLTPAGQAQHSALEAAAKWYEKAPEDFIASEPALWIYDESLLRSSTRPAELVWRMDVTLKDAARPIRELVLVNAQRGSISLHFNQIDTAWAPEGSSGAVRVSDPVATPLPTESPLATETPISTETSVALNVVEATPLQEIATGEISAVGATWYVATTGNDSNSCSLTGSPCKTLNAAIGKASAGDAIKVAIGIYTGTGTQVVLISKSISISGGWDALFATQSGMSTIDGQDTRQGIVINSDVNVVVDHFIIQKCSGSSTGGGILNSTGTMTLNNSIVRNNVSTWMGAGIYNYGTMTLNNTAVIDNTSGDYCCSGGGGGAGIETKASLTLNNSTVSGNKLIGGFEGSGIDAFGTLIINNSTVSGNSGGRGEGIHIFAGTAIINNSTISGNESYGISNTASTVTLQNTIVAGNDGTSDCYNNTSYDGTITSLGHNLIGHPSGCTFTPTTGDLVEVDAKLGKLVGFPGYLPLMPGSAAIDAGNPAVPGSGGSACLATDERGVTRPVGARCDIGAYEYTVPGTVASLLIVSGNEKRAAPRLAFSQPLAVAAMDSQGSPVPGISITFNAPASGASGTFADTGSQTTTAVTDIYGIATPSRFTANSVLGTYVVSAVSGVATTPFNLENFAWFVATSGSDSNSCSVPGFPCATIEGALNKISKGDTILVGIGEYTGSVPEGVMIANKQVYLSGGWIPDFTAQSGRSTIDGQGIRRGITTDSNANVVVDRFIIRNGVGTGIYNYYSVMVLNNSIVTENNDGGILNHGIMTVNSTTISNNTSGDPCCTGGGGGGGIDNSTGTLTLNNSLVSGNKLLGGFSGSGIYSGPGTVILNNTTISGNTGGDGAGISTFLGKITLNNSTISGNESHGISNTAGTITLKNTIVAGNGGVSDCYNNTSYSGTITSLGYNLIGNNKGCSFASTNGDLVGTESNPINPHLAPLQNYGGPTFIHALMSGSPAIDAGNPAAPGSGATACLATDQRGMPRSAGGRCDIGAFEYGGPGTTPTYIFPYAGTPLTIFRGSTSSTTLKALVLDEVGDRVPGVTVTFTAPATGASSLFIDTNTNVASVSTDANGIATSPALMANNILGTYTIVATAAGINGSANFQVTNAIAPVRTYTAWQLSDLPGSLLCDETAPLCTNGQHPHADKAHLYAIGTYNFYVEKHDRPGIDGNNMPIISTVNYCDPYFPCPYENAFWNGEQMVYGDAYGFPLADDVVAHELTHGVTQYESNLFYYYQAGAINESFSDLWGEYYDQTNSLGTDAANVKWLMGEDVSGQGAMRSMSDPPAYNDPDIMSSPLYYEGDEDSGGVHTNSGVNNKAIFLMVEGGTFNGITVTPLDWDKTASIYYEVNTNLLTSGADYSDLYYALQKACSNLIGQKGITAGDCAEVKDAMDAVEMNTQPAPNFNVDAPYCEAGDVPAITFADDLESGTGNWTFTNGAYLRWQWDSPFGPYAQSGLHSLYADDYPGSFTDATARLKAMVIPNNAYLHFAQAYDFEAGYKTPNQDLSYYDGGVLEYSLNGGSTWIDAGTLMDYNGYRDSIFMGLGNPLAGRSAFVGSSHGYISTRLDLTPLAGQSVTFRWRMGLDGDAYAWGWWVDNVKIYTCKTPPGAFHKGSPSHTSTDIPLTTTLSWSSSALATSYQYCYDTIDDNQCNRTWSFAPATSVEISNLGPNTTYYWQVRAVNADGITEADDQSWSSFTTTSVLPPGMTRLETFIDTNKQGIYSLENGESLRESYSGLNNGPVKLLSTDGATLIGAERVVYKVNGVGTSFTEMMGLPDSQLDTVYWLPWYNNVELDTQLRFANVSDSTATVHVYIGGDEMTGSPFTLLAGQSTRKSFPGISNGPVKIASDVNIVAAERIVYKVNGVGASFTEMMALPESQLDTTYYLPWYNNVALDTQLRFANVSDTTATVHVYIGEQEMTGSPFTLLAGESTRKSFAGVSGGPVKIKSDVPIVAAERVVYKVNGVGTSFTEMMGFPAKQLDTTYWLPWYNNVELDTQLRFANVSDTPASVHVYIGGVEMTGSPFTLESGASTRQSFNGINSGPVQIVSDVPIVAAERVVYKVNGAGTSFSEMMGLPDSLLDTSYWLPWYNNVELDTQLRFGVP